MLKTGIRWYLVALGLIGCAALAALLLCPASPTFTTPVYAHDAPDPAVIRADDGVFYAYTTQSLYSDRINIPILRSADLVQWELVGDAFPEWPDWVMGDLWAPHIIRYRDRFYLYYSAREYGSGNMAIGVAVADDPLGPFVDKGAPLARGPSFTTIDPFVLEVDGQLYLYWGSAGAPIRVQPLAEDGLSLVGEAQAVLWPSKDLARGYESLVEGPWIIQHGSYYYLMYSGNACCGDHAHYAVMVARSRSPFGPFEKYEENPILESNEKFWAPGHNATIQDFAGQDWILYHAMRQGDVTQQRYMLLDRIEWRDGWPVINDGQGPSWAPQVGPVVRPVR